MAIMQRIAWPVGLVLFALLAVHPAAGQDKEKVKEKEKEKEVAPPPAPAVAPGTFTVKPGGNLGGGLGGGGVVAPAAQAGFAVQPLAGGAAPKAPNNPLNQLINPGGLGPAATMTSQNWSNPPPGGWDSGWGYNLPDPFGGYLKGAADMTRAQGEYFKNVQQAYLLREDVKRSQLANRRAALEEWLWERSNMPTLEDERQRTQRESLRRASNDPPLPEIWSGQALNTLVASMTSKKGNGPNVPIDADIVKMINLSSGKGDANFGLFKNEGKLLWPAALTELQPAGEARELRNQMDNLTAEAFKKAKEGKVDPGSLREMRATAEKLEAMLKKNVNDMPFAQYSEGKRYVSQLYDGLKALGSANAKDFANGKFAFQGNTVGELVDYMTRNGLQFAPAVEGEWNAYVALHRALVAYSAGVNNLAADR